MQVGVFSLLVPHDACTLQLSQSARARVREAADQYGISALQGEKAAHLMETYDTSGDGSIGINE